MSSWNYRSFCLGLNVLTPKWRYEYIYIYIYIYIYECSKTHGNHNQFGCAYCESLYWITVFLGYILETLYCIIIKYHSNLYYYVCWFIAGVKEDNIKELIFFKIIVDIWS